MLLRQSLGLPQVRRRAVQLMGYSLDSVLVNVRSAYANKQLQRAGHSGRCPASHAAGVYLQRPVGHYFDIMQPAYYS